MTTGTINLQHYLWTELFGYHIHPSIPTSNPNLRIADVGTGTGIWLTDLSRRLPSTVSLNGLDISFSALPPKECLPSNMTLHSYDILSETPNHLRGVYDIVHVRNFSFVIRDLEAERVIRNVLQLLKPGGYLQWAEIDALSYRIEKTSPGCKDDALKELMRLGRGADDRTTPHWVPEIPYFFQQAKLEEVQSDLKDAPPYMAVAKHECNLIVPEMLARTTQNSALSEKFSRLIPEAVEETHGGAYWAFTRLTVVGRKASG
ncbi:hypothetical protein BO79DRAFT_259285 [Aspergillus costaricaensis CBS 115574]|uniref:Uncharacterized protein n=1 Tax=Aspergillus costaricaensis CBS 115574 TaxID=1448317 RepID=A0ACD1I2I2_9EURO|nr:hypothetical protein BO79DRAFT_259285 [Aspergillus costaricaensis CBS 115574]RAK84510.1 hypothetical protein BO79DRAFT_259285 [Aspergillus costaricaensis CBS 115574]